MIGYIQLLLIAYLPHIILCDSVIIDNECARTTEECAIRLETFNGLPGKDCYVFSNDYRSCKPVAESGDAQPFANSAIIRQTGDEASVLFSAQNQGGVHIGGSTIWNNPPRVRRYDGKGMIVTCLCRPIDRKKRDTARLVNLNSNLDNNRDNKINSNKENSVEENFDNCLNGFISSSNYVYSIEDPGLIRMLHTDSLINCAIACKLEFASKKRCIAFAFNVLQPNQCMLFNSLPEMTETSNNLYKFYKQC